MTTLPATQYRADPSDLWWKKRAQWIYESILSGEIVDHDDVEPTTHRVVIEQIGRLSLPGGRFVAADPYIMESTPTPFEQTLPTESAEVVAARAQIGPDRDRTAALMLRCGTNATINSWSMATTHGQDVTTLAGEGFFGYGVDAGTGSFGGVDAMAVACRVLAEDAGMLEGPISLAVAVCSSGFGHR